MACAFLVGNLVKNPGFCLCFRPARLVDFGLNSVSDCDNININVNGDDDHNDKDGVKNR